MKIVGIIPAHQASPRFPGKHLIDLKGKTMIQHVHERVKEAIPRVIVATDDQRIIEEVNRFGGVVMATNELHKTGTDRCGEVALLEEADVIVNIHGDEPLVNESHIGMLCRAFEDESVQIATLGVKGVSEEDLKNPNRVKIVKDRNNNALYFSRSQIPSNFGNEEIRNKNPYVRHIGLYAYRKKTLLELIRLERTELEAIESLEQLRWLYNGYKIRVVEVDGETPHIKTPKDVEKVLKKL